MSATAGTATPLGPSVQSGGVNFAVWSSTASSIEVCIVDESGETPYPLPGRTGDVHHGFIPGIGPGARYGLRAHGSWQPDQGLRHDPAKLLIDPRARGVERPQAWRSVVFSGTPGNSSGAVPLSVVMDTPTPPRPVETTLDWAETILYEAHVSGLTRRNPDVPRALRGTFAGVGSEPIIDHLHRLGITSLELLPVWAFANEPRLERLGLTQYWGYNPISFFAPHAAYSVDRTPEGAQQEFVEMVDSLHRAGIEVILDVVLNHTAEGEPNELHLGLKGLDNLAYYRQPPNDPGGYDNITGTGNSLDLSHPAAASLALDALRYWAGTMGVDGFRFDLATVLGRSEGSGFSARAAFLQSIAADPIVGNLKLIAEPWDIGTGGYQLGRFPAPWREWNDRFRDDVRRFWRSEHAALRPFSLRVQGSPRLFQPQDRPAGSTINYVTSHDGFTLADLVAYNERHNEANGEANHDGHGENLSWNSGTEGPTGNPGIRSLRSRRARALMATMFLAKGVPMLVAGDEMGRTQSGNNNAYCQDNEISWIDWREMDTQTATFTAELIHLRELADVDAWWDEAAWIRPDGLPLEEEDWHGGHHLGAILGGTDKALGLMFVNGGHHEATFVVPNLGPRTWRLAIDTARLASSPLSLGSEDEVVVEGFGLKLYLADG